MKTPAVNLFRRRGGSDSLPSVSGSAVKRSSFLKRDPHDGSARNISVAKPLAVVWKETSHAVKVTWGLLFLFLFMVYFGIRWIRFQNAFVHLNCGLTSCTLSIMPHGWNKKRLVEMPRRQLLSALAVKTDIDGKFVSANPSLSEDIRPRKGKYKHGSASSYKGPDSDGYYISYALTFKDWNSEQRWNFSDPNVVQTSLSDLSPFFPYLEKIEDQQYRLILRQFRIGQSKRRARTMISKIDSYIKKRRQNLMVKETAAPSWQGILLIVLGVLGFLLILLVGQFWDEAPIRPSGPGVRRQSAPSSHNPLRDSMKRQTPSMYEVKTKPQVSSTKSNNKR